MRRLLLVFALFFLAACSSGNPNGLVCSFAAEGLHTFNGPMIPTQDGFYMGYGSNIIFFRYSDICKPVYVIYLDSEVYAFGNGKVYYIASRAKGTVHSVDLSPLLNPSVNTSVHGCVVKPSVFKVGEIPLPLIDDRCNTEVKNLENLNSEYFSIHSLRNGDTDVIVSVREFNFTFVFPDYQGFTIGDFGRAHVYNVIKYRKDDTHDNILACAVVNSTTHVFIVEFNSATSQYEYKKITVVSGAEFNSVNGQRDMISITVGNGTSGICMFLNIDKFRGEILIEGNNVYLVGSDNNNNNNKIAIDAREKSDTFFWIPIANIFNYFGTFSLENYQYIYSHWIAGGFFYPKRLNILDPKLELPQVEIGGFVFSSIAYKVDRNNASDTRYRLVYGFRVSGGIKVFELPSPCRDGCSGYGKCEDGMCKCNEKRSGPYCNIINCNKECAESGGSCVNGNCKCPSNKTGPNCDIPRCLDDCMSRGSCSGEPDYICECDDLYSGDNCGVLASKSCDKFKEDECMRKIGCGWCHTRLECISGNLDGPSVGTCRVWSYSARWQISLLIIALLIICIGGLMILNNVLSLISINYATAIILGDPDSFLTSGFLKESYWRDERSSKAWFLFEMFQFFSYYTMIGVSFPSGTIQFLSYFNWANFNIPRVFWNIQKMSHENRSINNVDQYSNTFSLNPTDVYYATLFWYCCFAVAIILIYVIYATIMWVIVRSRDVKKMKDVLVGRFFYVLTYLVLIGQIPIVFTSCWHIRGGYGERPVSVILAIFTLILFGVIPIIFNMYVVWGKGKSLLLLYLKLRFGALYSVYHYEKAMFNIVVLLRRVLIALFLGFWASSSPHRVTGHVYAQVICIVLVMISYLAILVFIRPYLDQVHYFLDIVVISLKVLIVCTSLMHINGPSGVSEIITYTSIGIIFMICCITYVHSWTNIVGRDTYPTVFFSKKIGPEELPTNAHPMNVLDENNIKKIKGDITGALPQKKSQVEYEESSVDSSLRSSEDDNEDDVYDGDVSSDASNNNNNNDNENDNNNNDNNDNDNNNNNDNDNDNNDNDNDNDDQK